MHHDPVQLFNSHFPDFHIEPSNHRLRYTLLRKVNDSIQTVVIATYFTGSAPVMFMGTNHFDHRECEVFSAFYNLMKSINGGRNVSA